ncbi:MAG: DUF4910 domain-containing protein [Alphaproteobacteria bacterium]
MTTEHPRWRTALDKLWTMNRVHCGPDMSAAYRDLATIYDHTEVFGFPSGDTCGSWTAPQSWTVEHATLTAPDGSVVADFSVHPLHLYTFSPPFKGTVSRAELDEHLFSMPGKPDRIPFHFRNQYRHWQTEWGFCISQNARDALPDGDYTVDIATGFQPGMMEMAEQVHPGELADSLLLVGHFDHPHMCNDGLVGCLAGHEAISRLAGRKTHLTYRMLSTVEIIGSVFYAAHMAGANTVRQAMFVASSGADAPLAYQKTFAGDSVIDRVMAHVLDSTPGSASFYDFRKGPLGNDETAFDVGGVGIPCGSIMRAPFDVYHTDIDTPDNVHDDKFEQKVELIGRAINVLEGNATLKRKFSGLPCLSSPDLDLYLSPGRMSQVAEEVSTVGVADTLTPELAAIVRERSGGLNYLMNILPLMCEGDMTTLDVAEKSGLPFEFVDAYTDKWVEKGLLKKTWINPFDDA